MKDEQSAFLMIGGPIDGEIHAIPPNTRTWCVPTLGPMEPLRFKDIGSDPPNAVPYTEHTYSKFILCSRTASETLSVFVHEDIMRHPDRTYRIILELLNHYKVIK